jgi:hypothetical protein
MSQEDKIINPTNPRFGQPFEPDDTVILLFDPRQQITDLDLESMNRITAESDLYFDNPHMGGPGPEDFAPILIFVQQVAQNLPLKLVVSLIADKITSLFKRKISEPRQVSISVKNDHCMFTFEDSNFKPDILPFLMEAVKAIQYHEGEEG